MVRIMAAMIMREVDVDAMTKNERAVFVQIIFESPDGTITRVSPF